jgi:hypothetical protein
MAYFQSRTEMYVWRFLRWRRMGRSSKDEYTYIDRYFPEAPGSRGRRMENRSLSRYNFQIMGKKATSKTRMVIPHKKLNLE